MTLNTANPQANRKDISPLILNQTDVPCLPCGVADEGFMAFLMRLYAYFVSKLYDEMADAKSSDTYSPLAPRCEGSARLKGRLLTSGPYQMSVSKREAQGPHTPMVTSASRSLATRGWLIVWPGAARDTYMKIGRSAPAFHAALPTCRPNRAQAISGRHVIISNGGYRCTPSTLPTLRSIGLVRRHIPP